MSDQDREAFEKWIKESGSFTDWSKSAGGEIPRGEYLKPLVERTWQAWQAACKHARQSAYAHVDENHVAPQDGDSLARLADLINREGPPSNSDLAEIARLIGQDGPPVPSEPPIAPINLRERLRRWWRNA